MAYTVMTTGRALLASSEAALPNGGKVVTEIIEDGDATIYASLHFDPNGVQILGYFCGSCGGVSVGCVECPNNNPVVNCVTRTIYCG